MLDRISKFCMTLEKKLVEFVKGFKSQNLGDYQKKLQSQYAKFKP